MVSYTEKANLEEKTEVNDQQAGAFLRQARKAKGLTRQELADKIGCHINTIYNLEERGQASLEMWRAVAGELGYEHQRPHIFIPK